MDKTFTNEITITHTCFKNEMMIIDGSFRNDISNEITIIKV